MRILSFDTSTTNLYASLVDGENVLAEQILICKPEDRQFAASLIIPTLEDLFKKAGWLKTDAEIIAVGVGPGGFTGTRIAVVMARTLAQALNLPLLGINRFECYAFTEQIDIFPTAIILTAGKKQYYCAALIDKASLEFYWNMNTEYVLEDDLDSYLANVKQVYSEVPLDHYQLLSDSSNLATTQAMLADGRIKSLVDQNASLLNQFPYQKIRPLYVRNASVTVKSS